MKKLLEVIKENKVYIFPWVVLVILIVIMAFGLTYAYFDYIIDSDANSSLRVTATDLHVTLSNPTVDLSDLFPIYDEYKDTQANTFTFTLSNTSRKLAGCVDLYLTFTSISEDLKSPDIKWELVNNTLNTTTNGNFENVDSNRLLLKENQSIPINTTYSYTLKIWYSFSPTQNQTLISGSMNAKLTSIAYGGACAATKVTTYTSGTNQFTASVDGYYRIETYNANGSYSSGELFLAIGEKIYASVGAPSNIKCYIDSSTGLCGTKTTQNDDNSRIMYAGSNFSSSFVSGLAGVNAPTYVNSTSELSNNTLHPTGKFFLNGNLKFSTGNTTARIVITYLGKYQEKANTKLDNVRYIKDCTSGNSVNNANHWVEIQAIKNGVNIAYKKTLSGASTDSKIVDGIITSSQYVSVGGTNKCVTVDLGRAYDVDEIAIWHYYSDGRTYNNNVTSVSNNNSTWTEVINKTEAETQYGKRVSAYAETQVDYAPTDPSLFTYTVSNNQVTITGHKLATYTVSNVQACKNNLYSVLMNGEEEVDDTGTDSLCENGYSDDLGTLMQSFLYSGIIPLSEYSNCGLSNVTISNVKDIVIPSEIDGKPVVAISTSVFRYSRPTSITIPSSVTSIGETAFADNKLTSIAIPGSVTSIGRGAFSYNQLTSVTIPDSVVSIGDFAFTENQLTSVTIKTKTSSSQFSTYGNGIWGWASGVTCVTNNTSNVTNGCITWGA